VMKMSVPSSFVSGISKNPRYERFLGYARTLADSQCSLRFWTKDTPPRSNVAACGVHMESEGGGGE